MRPNQVQKRCAAVLAVALIGALLAPSPAFAAATQLNIINTIPTTRAGDVFTVSVEALEADGVTRDTNFGGMINLNASAVGGSNFTPAQSQAAVQGLATFNVSLLNAANGYSVTASSPGLTSDVSNSFNVTARSLVVNTISSPRAGDVFNVTVNAVDAQATPQLAENFNGSVSLTLNVPAGGSGFAVAPGAQGASSGTVTFNNLQLLNAANGYSVTAMSAGVIGATSNSFNATARTLVIVNAIDNNRAGDPFNVQVQAFDAQAIPQLAENFNGSVSLTPNVPAGGSGFAVPPGTQSATAGTATFNSLQLLNAANGYSVTATSPGVIGATSNSFNVTARSLVVNTISSPRAGDVFNVTVNAVDAQGTPQVAENFNGSVSLSLNVPTGGSGFAVAPGAQSASSGTVTFSNLQLLNAANGYSVTATSPGVIGGTSNSFNATARTLVIVNAIDNNRAGNPFNVQVMAFDAQAIPQLAENFNGTVNLAANEPVAGSDFESPVSQAASSGTATFNGLQLLNAANGYSVTATSAGVIGATSNSFNVTARTLVVNNIFSPRTGDPFNVTVNAVDAQATPQLAENFNGSVSLTVNVPTGGSGFAAAPGAQSASSGTTTFNNLQLLNAANGYSVAATSAGVIGGTSNSFDATARTFILSTTIANTRAGDPFDVQVNAFDAQAVPQIAENFNGTVNLTANEPLTGSDFESPVSQAATSGTAAFNDLQLLNAANGYSITATSAGFPSSTSNTFNITARGLVISPFGNPIAGDEFNIQVSAVDAQTTPQVAENYNGDVSLDLSIPLGGSGFSVAPGPQTASSGTANFNDLQMLNAADGYLLFAGGSGVDAGQRNFNVTASQLVIVTNISNKVAGRAFNVSVQARDAQDNLAENFDGPMDLSASAPLGGSNFAGGTKTQNGVDGIVSFTGLRLNTAANDYTVTADVADIPAAVSNVFDVTADVLSRTISLRLSRHLVASGVLRAGGDSRCTRNMPVRVQRRTRRGWATVGTDTTNASGVYRARVPDRAGNYRAVAPQSTLASPTTVCRAATSVTRLNR